MDLVRAILRIIGALIILVTAATHYGIPGIVIALLLLDALKRKMA